MNITHLFLTRIPLRSPVYVLAQATKHASTQCVFTSHPDFQGEQLDKIL